MKRMFVCCLLIFASTPSPAVPPEEESIAALFTDRFAAAWRDGDAESLAELWLKDGDWMSIIGSRRTFSGWEQLAQVWTIGLQGRDDTASRSIDIDIDHIRQLTPDMAQVDLVMVFGQPSTGVLKEAMVALVCRHEDEWRIASSRVARISYEPAQVEEES